VHGSAYYFGMNDALNATALLSGPNPVLRVLWAPDRCSRRL
jgi:hypothetical protein